MMMPFVLQIICTVASVVAAAPAAERLGMRPLCPLLREKVAPAQTDQPEASRFRIALPPRPARTNSSRQAMTWARVTTRNSSRRPMLAKRMKSFTAFW